MRGIELSREYYELYGAPMIHSRFPELEGVLAVGLCGAGSECFGFDDDVSRDHDFDPGFCIFVPDDVDRADVFKLERAYSSLPREFRGLSRAMIAPAGGSRRGVIMQSDFFMSRTGHADGVMTAREWLRVPEHYIAEAVNGVVFRDDAGVFTKRRLYLQNVPDDVTKKRLAGHLLLMSQSGGYNYPRQIARGETASAQLAAIEFVRHASGVCFCAARVPMPFYKWAPRAFSLLPEPFSSLYDTLEFLISSDNDPKTAKLKSELIADVCARILGELRALDFTRADSVQRAAFECNDSVRDADIRSLDILYGVD